MEEGVLLVPDRAYPLGLSGRKGVCVDRYAWPKFENVKISTRHFVRLCYTEASIVFVYGSHGVLGERVSFRGCAGMGSTDTSQSL